MDEAIRRFVNLLRRISKWRRDAALISEVILKELEIAPGYYLAEWARQPANRDLWRWILGMQNRAPFSDVLPPGIGDGVEYFWSGRTARALGAAHLLDGILVSLLIDPAWEATWIHAARTVLAADPNGEPALRKSAVEVRHAATINHAESHMEWVKKAGFPDLKNGVEIWDARGDVFPHLRFLPRTESQFRGLSPGWVVPAAYELRRIDDAIGDWDPRLARAPIWRSKVTPEAETRKRLCRFEDFDGIERIFDLHGRFTPGPGRIYFRLVPESGNATIAHVGPKLGI